MKMNVGFVPTASGEPSSDSETAANNFDSFSALDSLSTSHQHSSPSASPSPSLAPTLPPPTIQENFASPYLHYDPRLLSQPQFIYPPNEAVTQIKTELAFASIGCSVIAGALVGGTAGFFNSLRPAQELKLSGKLYRTHLINYVAKQGMSTSNTMGTLSLIYTLFDMAFQRLRNKDDDANTLMAATSTGLLYKATAGIRKCAMGGAMGFAISALYCLTKFIKN